MAAVGLASSHNSCQPGGVWESFGSRGENLLQFTMVFYTQGILYCTYIGTVQVHIAFLKFYMQKNSITNNKSRQECFRLEHEQILTQFEEIIFFITLLISGQVYIVEL